MDSSEISKLFKSFFLLVEKKAYSQFSFLTYLVPLHAESNNNL